LGNAPGPFSGQYSSIREEFRAGGQSLDQLKETFSNAQTALGEEWRGKFDFFLPALEEIRNDAQNMNPQARKKVEDLKNRFEQALKPSAKG
jgi:hypothetical protein